MPDAERAKQQAAAALAEEIRDLGREDNRLGKDIASLRHGIDNLERAIRRNPKGLPDHSETRHAIAQMQGKVATLITRRAEVEQRLGQLKRPSQAARATGSAPPISRGLSVRPSLPHH